MSSLVSGLPSGLEGVKQTFRMLRKAFPDLQVVAHDMIAGERDIVVTRATLSGTQKGELMGIAPTGKRVTVDMIEIVRFTHDKIVEHWGITDSLSMMQQLGVTPKMA